MAHANDGPSTTRSRRVVVGVDGSPESLAALAWAVSEAEAGHDEVVAVMAWDYLSQPHLPGEDGFDPDFDGDRATAILDELVDDALARGGRSDATVLRRAVLGLPAAVLIDASDDADLLVVGRRGLGGFKGLLMGSVSQHLVAHAHCPVVVTNAVHPT